MHCYHLDPCFISHLPRHLSAPLTSEWEGDPRGQQGQTTGLPGWDSIDPVSALPQSPLGVHNSLRGCLHCWASKKVSEPEGCSDTARGKPRVCAGHTG